MDSPHGALDDVKILDLSRWIAGPYCTMLLADMGADVIRVERPGGEDARHLPPFIGQESAYYLHYNRNKRAITLDTRHEDARSVLAPLLAWADILVQNYRPGTMAKMGFDDQTLHELNPRLIVTAISGYGQIGEWSSRPLFNAVAEATAGLMALNGADGNPAMTGNFAADHSAGLHAAFATLAALHERERSGLGQVVDVALFDSTLSIIGFPWTSVLNGLADPGIRQAPNRDTTAVPGNTFPTADGRSVYIDAGTDALFAALVSAIGSDSLAADAAFSTVAAREERVEEIETAIAEWTASLRAYEVSARLEEAGVPHGVVLTIAEVVSHPAVRDRALVTTFEETGLRVPSPPVKLSRTPASVRRPPPVAGADTDDVLCEICGFDREAIERLGAEGAI